MVKKMMQFIQFSLPFARERKTERERERGREREKLGWGGRSWFTNPKMRESDIGNLVMKCLLPLPFSLSL